MKVIHLVALLSILVCYGEGYKTDCVFHGYLGGPGEVIAKFEPTLPGKISLEISDSFVKMVYKLFSSDDSGSRRARGVPVPEIAGAVGTLFSVVGTLTDNTADNLEGLQNAINDLIDDVRKTVEDLKKYVDAKFNEYDYDKKSEVLKGIYDQSLLCAAFNHPENLETCLKNLLLEMVGQYSNFLPADPKYETFEQLLPMTRQFADLHFAALIDVLKMTKVDPDYKSAIANFSVTIYNYFVHGINVIVDQHLKNTKDVSCDSVNYKQICISYCYTPPCPRCFCTHIGAYECQQEWDNGDGCKRQFPDPEDTSDDNNCIFAGFYWTYRAKMQIKQKLAPYHKDLETNVRKYWKADVGETMEHWKEIGIKAGASECSYLPYSAEPITSQQLSGLGYNKAAVAKYLSQLIHVLQNAIAHKMEM